MTTFSCNKPKQIGKQDYNKWAIECRSLLQLKARTNYFERVDKIVDIVNESCLKYNPSSLFSIAYANSIEILGMINDKIVNWPGVSIKACKKKGKSKKEYISTANNWFNRNKAKIYGNYFYSRVIFGFALQYCRNTIEERYCYLAFIDILDCILTTRIKYPKSRKQPLIQLQALMQPNSFKNLCLRLLKKFDIKWKVRLIAKSQPMLAGVIGREKDKDRAKRIHAAFLDCLLQIKQRLIMEQNICDLPPQMYPRCMSPQTSDISESLMYSPVMNAQHCNLYGFSQQQMMYTPVVNLLPSPLRESVQSLQVQPELSDTLSTVTDVYHNEWTLSLPTVEDDMFTCDFNHVNDFDDGQSVLMPLYSDMFCI